MLLLLLLLSRFSRDRLCATPSLGFSRQEHWSGFISFSNAWKWKVKVKSLSRVWLFTTPWTVAYQASPSMGFSRQEYWSGLLCWIVSPFLPFLTYQAYLLPMYTWKYHNCLFSVLSLWASPSMHPYSFLSSSPPSLCLSCIHYTDTYRTLILARVVRNLSASAGDSRDSCLIPELGRSPGEGSGNPFQYSCLENPMDRQPWQATVHGVAKNWAQMSTYYIIVLKYSSHWARLRIQNNKSKYLILSRTQYSERKRYIVTPSFPTPCNTTQHIPYT